MTTTQRLVWARSSLLCVVPYTGSPGAFGMQPVAYAHVVNKRFQPSLWVLCFFHTRRHRDAWIRRCTDVTSHRRKSAEA
ncbi:hypothetical protein AOLI_G00189820 [Acnodon oligacanthus]